MTATGARGPATAADRRWLNAALMLAERAQGLASPNPGVGCVLVRDGIVVGRGWTQAGGRPHAEAVALDAAGPAAHGATAYVTLEPCAHASARGPACADLLVAAGIARVVAGIADPDPRTAGGGLARLRVAGIDADSIAGLCRDAKTAAPFERLLFGHRARTGKGRPGVTLKLATSLDGQIALASGESRWITGERARAHVHLERARHAAILVGRRTYLTDTPRLDVRLAGLEGRSPARLLLSRTAAAPEGWTVLRRPADIAALPFQTILVEGGAQTAAAFLRAGLVDRLLLYRAPILIGAGRAALGDIGLTDLGSAHGRWTPVDARQFGDDRMELYERTDPA